MTGAIEQRATMAAASPVASMRKATGRPARLSGSVPTAVIAMSAALGTPRSSRTMTPSLSCLIATEEYGGVRPREVLSGVSLCCTVAA